MTSFASRHIGPRPNDLLTTLGYESSAALIAAAVPETIQLRRPLNLPAPLSEPEVTAKLRAIAQENVQVTSMIGQGYFGTHTPAVIKRSILENPAWYTAYTPYQPEISQGRLEAMLNFQTMIADLTGLPVAGASLLDEATAVAEAILLMRRAVRGRPDGRILLDSELLPAVRNVAIMRAKTVGIVTETVDVTAALAGDGLASHNCDVLGVVLAQVGASGVVRDLTPLVSAVHERGGLVTVVVDPLAATMLRTAGEMAADVAVGSAQRFGVPLFYGGPHAAFMSVRTGLERNLPGRLVGLSRDAHGNAAYRLALATREQHIRRERATSNICTAQALLAVVAGAFACYHGAEGLREIAQRVHACAFELAAQLRTQGLEVVHEVFFDTVRVRVPQRAEAIRVAALARGINVFVADDDHVQLACDETTTPTHLRAVLAAFRQVTAGDCSCGASGVAGEARADVACGAAGDRAFPTALHSAFQSGPLVRQTPYLTHPIFTSLRSETGLMRYLRGLADKDLALDRSMIPLGSCTMKLNAAVELEPITWPEFTQLHPLAPVDQVAGYAHLIADLETWLAEITGYDRISLQPNAGSQGELAGLLAIRRYHESRGEGQRNVCLIPASAHGTNAASAVLAGWRVVVVATAPDGTIDETDLAAKIAAHTAAIAAIMLTYPSTHGVYEEGVRRVCSAVHDAGGQVYIDGANLNALVGVARPGDFGGDVSHLNLHKTFCIPHGGGGPGVGPIGVAAHLAPFLPGDPQVAESGAVSGAKYGSAGILPITWAYIALMGGEGLKQATEMAVAAANYVARQLAEYYPVLYTGASGLVAHECILDIRDIAKTTGITAEDIAKRLADYGFHAPTLSFPVAGTLMVEPTESEDTGELDRFIAAMIAIRAEIDAVGDRYDAASSPLRGAPHTGRAVTTADWERPYSREQAAFPPGVCAQRKYWPPVGRIDQAYGDRHLVCSCPPLTAFDED